MSRNAQLLNYVEAQILSADPMACPICGAMIAAWVRHECRVTEESDSGLTTKMVSNGD